MGMRIAMSRHRCMICRKELTQDETITLDVKGWIHNYCKEHAYVPLISQIKKDIDAEWEWSS